LIEVGLRQAFKTFWTDGRRARSFDGDFYGHDLLTRFRERGS
jgi:hypothetical protein